jgi:hypothetical protein
MISFCCCCCCSWHNSIGYEFVVCLFTAGLATVVCMLQRQSMHCTICMYINHELGCGGHC